jgi:hypothetical protein
MAAAADAGGYARAGVSPLRQICCAMRLSACLVIALGAQTATASRGVPPNNSAIDQFLTTTPGPAGDERLPRGRETVPGALRDRERRRLRALDGEGERAIAVLAESAPAAASRAAARPRVEGDAAPSSRWAAVASVGTGKGRDGLGLVLPGILIGAVALAAVARRRRRPTGAQAHEGPQPGMSNTA